MHAEISDTLDAFERFTAGLGGELVIAVLPPSEADPFVLGEDRAFHAWSTIKVPVLVAVLTVLGGRGLTPQVHDLAQRAIIESDNPAILELWELLCGLAGGVGEAAAVVEGLFRRSGDQRSTVALATPPPGAVTPFGQTGWNAADSSRFLSALAAGSLLGPGDTRYVLGLMEGIISEQRWGLGSVDLAGPTAFKGGWGPEPDGACLVRQGGIVLGPPGGRGATAISLVAVPPPGEESFEVGVRMIDAAAAWVAEFFELVR